MFLPRLRDQHDRNRAARFSFAPAPAEFAHQFDRFIDNIRRQVECRPEPDRALARAQRQHAELEESSPEFFARFWIGQIEREKQPTATRSRDGRFFAL